MNRTGLLAALIFTSLAAAQDISPAERQRALDYLNQTRASMLSAAQGLSDAQFHFKPAPDRWSVGDVMEHLTIIEQFVVNDMRTKFHDAPAPKRDAAALDDTILSRVPDRSVKAKAPEMVQPSGQWSKQETLEKFTAARAGIIEVLKTAPDLRAHVLPHPAFGEIDGYQWILLLATHTDRHLKQIAEVKADPNFPAR